MDFLARPCPTCGATELDSKLVASRRPAETCTFETLRAGWRGFFRDEKFFFTYRACRACGQLYAPQYFTPAQLTELYGQMDDNTGGQDEALLLRTQRGYWDALTSSTEILPGDYLELGPDIGLFTQAAAEHSLLQKFWLVEPNAAVHPALAEVVAKRSHAILSDPAGLDAIADHSLSLAVAIHVLDHLLEPQSLVQNLARKLKPGGCLLAVTHSERSLAARVFGRRWPAYCLQHPQLYAPKTLRQAYERAGLIRVKIQRTTNFFPVSYLLRHGFFAAGLGRVAVPLPYSWTAGLRLGNMAAIGIKE